LNSSKSVFGSWELRVEDLRLVSVSAVGEAAGEPGELSLSKKGSLMILCDNPVFFFFLFVWPECVSSCAGEDDDDDKEGFDVSVSF